MVEGAAGAAVAQKVRLAISELSSLSVLPSVAVQFLSKVVQGQFSPAALAEIVEADPAIACRILWLSSQEGTGFPDERYSVRAVLDRLPADSVRDAILAVKVSAAFEIEHGERIGGLSRKDLILHSIAVACCAKEIAQIMSPPLDPELAYMAGLLHDIGKLALQEIMPKSFAQIVEKAESSKQNSCIAEQDSLGIDHTIIGKSLAEKWQLPEAILLGIWLHHSDTAAISRNMPEARIAQVVQAADLIARQGGFSRSGSFDQPESVAGIAESLGVALQHLEQIRGQLPDTVKKKSESLHLDMPNGAARYCDIIQAVAAEFAGTQTEVSGENRNLQADLNQFNWLREFVLGIGPGSRAIEIAENFATRWQRFYQTGSVCLYLVPPDNAGPVEAVVVEALGQSKKIILEAPTDSPLIPGVVANKFSVSDAADQIDWLFEQLETDFDLNQTKLVPLFAYGKAVGAIVFELHYPGDARLFAQKFESSASVAGVVLGMACGRQRQEQFAERFARVVSKPKDSRRQEVSEGSLDALAEMAAGVAHELNNPLSVIAGRAQLLAEGERDDETKESLVQIQENAREASGVVDELMSFAQPDKPRPARTQVRQMLEEAVQLAGQKTQAEHLNVQIQVAGDVQEVFVDSAQVVSSIANVISNSVESYVDTIGPIKITAETTTGGGVRLQISDLGCGMDAETIRKATYPFFSAKPAGRKRGMGLAYAARLIQLNKGSLQITSDPGKGTSVTISLPSR